MSNTPETEALRISGNVTVPKGQTFPKEFEVDFNAFIRTRDYQFSGSIVPQDDETGMRLYRVEEVAKLNVQIKLYEERIANLIEKESQNNKTFVHLSEELAQEREKYYKLYKSFILLDDKCVSQDRTIGLQSDTIQALEKRLELAENNRWRTFIKWWKGLWKRLKLK
jgi:coenzyme F420-reducing hydrogenase alpha subunit